MFNWLIRSCCIVLSLYAAGIVSAQKPEQDKIPRDHVRFKTGVSIGLTSVSSFVTASLTDELGFEYDTMSLIERPEIRTALSIEDDQFIELSQSQHQFLQEVKSNGLLFSIDKDQQLLKAQFVEFENEVNSKLSDEQQQRLAELRIQLGIALHGAKEYLSSERMREKLGLTKSDLELLPTKTATTKLKKTQLSKSYREANKKLVAKLKRIQADEIADFFHDYDSDFLTKILFVRDTKKPISHRLSRIQALHYACKKQTKKTLQLESNQIRSLEELRRNIEADRDPIDAIAKIMTTEQFEKFEQLFTARQIKKWGTVRTLSDGYLSQRMGIKPDESKMLVEMGQQLHAELKEIGHAKALDGINKLSSSNQEQIRDLIGEQISFDLK